MQNIIYASDETPSFLFRNEPVDFFNSSVGELYDIYGFWLLAPIFSRLLGKIGTHYTFRFLRGYCVFLQNNPESHTMRSHLVYYCFQLVRLTLSYAGFLAVLCCAEWVCLLFPLCAFQI